MLIEKMNSIYLCAGMICLKYFMRIITWNCNMAFRKKANIILTYSPDILIVPECEHPDRLKFEIVTPKPNDTIWYGPNQNKGLGIFSYSNYRFKLLDIHNPELQLFIPIAVKNEHFSFTLYAIWAHDPNDPDGQYITQVWKAIHHYDKFITNRKTILIGDFNSNAIWDRPRREGNHSTVVERLEKKGIHSVYHKYFKQKQGKEQHPTLYMYRHKDKPYHIDYCFASEDIVNKLKSVEIGTYNFWRQYSDHVPLIVTFKLTG